MHNNAYFNCNKVTETAAKRTPVVESYNYFPLASTPDAQRRTTKITFWKSTIKAMLQLHHQYNQCEAQAMTPKNTHVKWTERSDKL